jgi:hypothetical protein
MMSCQKKNIRVIRGDILEVYFEIIGIEPEGIKDVYFTAARQGFSVKLPYSQENEGYCLRFGSDVTELLSHCIGSYDLTVELIDGNKMTLISDGAFDVLKKRNKIKEEE